MVSLNTLSHDDLHFFCKGLKLEIVSLPPFFYALYDLGFYNWFIWSYKVLFYLHSFTISKSLYNQSNHQIRPCLALAFEVAERGLTSSKCYLEILQVFGNVAVIVEARSLGRVWQTLHILTFWCWAATVQCQEWDIANNYLGICFIA